MKKFSKYGEFSIFVDGEYLMRVGCLYGEVLDLIWPIHFENPDADIEIRVVGSGESYHHEE